MKVVHVAFEAAPIYKVGGLGDVVGSLPKILLKEGIDTVVVLPKYGWIDHPDRLPGSQVPVIYIESPWFAKLNIRHDKKIQAPKFAAFALGTLEELKRQGIRPDIIHCHDWHTGLIPLLLKKQPDSYFEGTKTILTIHNIGYQGVFPCNYITGTGFEALVTCFGEKRRVSYLKEGMETADFLTTVSPTHAREMRHDSFGLRRSLRRRRGRFVGILNGIDYGVWNPRIDTRIYATYNRVSALTKKAENKTRLQKDLGLNVSPDIPLFGFVARLTSQKGLELLIPLLTEAPRKRIQVVILGSGDPKYENILKNLRKVIDRQWYAVEVKFDEELAHRIYAGSDFFLIPSIYEPCGLTQMIAMAYGSIPVVSAVGGLVDTVEDGKTGLVFREPTTAALATTIERASDLWEDKEAYSKMVNHAMRKDFSWKKSAREYARLYRRVIGT